MPGGFMLPEMMTGFNVDAAGFGSSSFLAQPNMMENQMNRNAAESNYAAMREIEDQRESRESSYNNRSDGSGGEGQYKATTRKRHQRHTAHQIQEMECFFKECPHPDDQQRRALGHNLGLDPSQVKFWFQNKRTQMKAQKERSQNTQLRNEYEKLREDNILYREALSTSTCPTCGGPTAVAKMSSEEHLLTLENAKLKDEIDRLSAVTTKYIGRGYPRHPHLTTATSQDLGAILTGDIYTAAETDDLLKSCTAPTNADKPLIHSLASAAMEELIATSHMMEPLWSLSTAGTSATLNENEYMRAFPSASRVRTLGSRSEGSREVAIVVVNPRTLVEVLMDANKWMTMFSNIVSRAMIVDVLSVGVNGNYDEALQVMTAEYQIPTPFVSTRQSYFARYCKRHANGFWTVVDISLDNLNHSQCRRRPSGCVIEELPNGCSKVIWVENVEVDNGAIHNLYKQLIFSGNAFGAKRWVDTLDRQCHRLASAMSSIPAGGIGAVTDGDGKRGVMKLAERMVMTFCSSVCASSAHQWMALAGADDVSVMTKKNVDDPGKPFGVVLNAASSFWLPISPLQVFDFLRDENSRTQWDILSNGATVQKVTHIDNGKDARNCISLLQIIGDDTSQSNMMIIQESFSDATASYVVYAPVDVVAVNAVLSGGEPENVSLLPSGFSIVHDGTAATGVGRMGGSILTMSFQILVSSAPSAKLSLGSVATVNNLIACTVENIRSAFCPDNL